MLTTTRTRLTLMSLERRETPTVVDPINLPAEPAATIRSSPALDIRHKADAVNIGAELAQVETMSVESRSAADDASDAMRSPAPLKDLPNYQALKKDGREVPKKE